MSKAKQDTTPTTKTLHQQLQAIAAAERVRTVLQLLPYTAPKVEKVTTTYGEGWASGWE